MDIFHFFFKLYFCISSGHSLCLKCIIYLHLDGNFGGFFRVEKTTGVIRSNASFDREEKEAFEIVIKATSNPDYIVYEVS